MDWVLIALISAIISAMIGSRKGEWQAAFTLGLLFGPFGILLAIFSKGDLTPCPSCKGLIANDARKCKHCGAEIKQG